MSDASKRSRFYYDIAERISAYLPPSSRVFNAGGGLGDLAIWLSYHVEQVTVIENDPKAVAAFRARCPHNVVAMLGDVMTYAPDRLYDALVLYDVGGVDQILPVVRELSRAKTFVLMELNGADAEVELNKLTETLKSGEIPYLYETIEREYVQPLRSIEDAQSYFLLTGNRTFSEDELAALLERTEDAELPLLFREKKKLGMVVFDAANPALKKPLF